MKLSKKSLLLLQAIFSENSGFQVPVGVAKEVIEIKEWVEKKLKEEDNLKNEEKRN
jgi:hypothetical protein